MPRKGSLGTVLLRLHSIGRVSCASGSPWFKSCGHAAPVGHGTPSSEDPKPETDFKNVKPGLALTYNPSTREAPGRKDGRELEV